MADMVEFTDPSGNVQSCTRLQWERIYSHKEGFEAVKPDKTRKSRKGRTDAEG